MFRIAIIDDEKNCVDTLQGMLSFQGVDFEIVGIAHNVVAGLSLLQSISIDVLFLDVEMPDGTGFDLLDRLDKINFDVIFTTAYNQYAIKAFRYAALDYLMKPVNLTELEQALQRVHKFGDEQKNEKVEFLLENHKAENKFEKLTIPTHDGTFIFSVDKLIRCEADGSYTLIVSEERKPLLASKSIKEYESILPSNFLRVHKSHLVNLNYADRLEGSEPKLILKDQSEVVVARRRKQVILDYLKQA